MSFKKVLIIQTAFIGDVILATPLIEKISVYYPNASIDFLVRKGNEKLLQNNPRLNEILIWNKSKNKFSNLIKLTKKIRTKNYDWVINCHRFLSSGILTSFSGANLTTGFRKNPLSFSYHEKHDHIIGDGTHEVARNLKLVAAYTDNELIKPALYPSKDDYNSISKFKTKPYLCIAPTSVWHTKQYPYEKWVELLDQIKFEGNIYLLGAKEEHDFCSELTHASGQNNIYNLAGELNLLQSAALMRDAIINYVNDSAPLHLASAVNARTCAIFCSTVPGFGFGPLADYNVIIQEKENLACRPCGLHGFNKCPEGHFKCGYTINTRELVSVLEKAKEII